MREGLLGQEGRGGPIRLLRDRPTDGVARAVKYMCGGVEGALHAD